MVKVHVAALNALASLIRKSLKGEIGVVELARLDVSFCVVDILSVAKFGCSCVWLEQISTTEMKRESRHS